MKYIKFLAIPFLIGNLAVPGDERSSIENNKDDFGDTFTYTQIGKQVFEKCDKIVIRSMIQGDIEFEGAELSNGVNLLSECVSEEWSADSFLIKNNDTWLVLVECWVRSSDQTGKETGGNYKLLIRFPINRKICKNGNQSIKRMLKKLSSKPEKEWIVRRHQDALLDLYFGDK